MSQRLAQTAMKPAQLRSCGLNPASQCETEVYQQQGFSHLIKTDDELETTFELIKILCRFQHSTRWTLLIAPQNIPDKALLNGCPVDMERVLVIHEKQITNMLSTIENALSHATCSAVIAWCDNIGGKKLAEINRQAKKSRCHFYAFNKHRQPSAAAQKSH